MLTKVTLEYSDGTKKYIDGKDAQKWSTFNEQVAIAAMIHNMNPPWETIEWKEEGQIVKHEQEDIQENTRKEENTSKEGKETEGAQDRAVFRDRI
jgi:hypothetical protein